MTFRRLVILGIAISIGFIAIDWIWLSALPLLDVSFGPLNPAWWLFSSFHIFLCMAFVLVLAAFTHSGRRAVKFRAKLDWIFTDLSSKLPVVKKFRPIFIWIEDHPWSIFYAFLATNVILLGVGLYGFYIEPFRIETTYLTIPSTRSLPAISQNSPIERAHFSDVHLSSPDKSRTQESKDAYLRIVQLSDFHVEQTTQRERDLPAIVNSLHPDIIVLTGDYISVDNIHNPISQRDVHTLVSQLHATQGIYAVLSSTDDRLVMEKVFKGTEVSILDDSVHRVKFQGGSLFLLGVTVGANRMRDSEMVAHLMSSIPQEANTILLYHTPDILGAARSNGVDLYLAGHTHGGQVRLPVLGAVFTNASYRTIYTAGLYKVENIFMYVNRGIGMAGNSVPRARFLSPPEVLVIDYMLPNASQSSRPGQK